MRPKVIKIHRPNRSLNSAGISLWGVVIQSVQMMALWRMNEVQIVHSTENNQEATLTPLAQASSWDEGTLDTGDAQISSAPKTRSTCFGPLECTPPGALVRAQRAIPCDVPGHAAREMCPCVRQRAEQDGALRLVRPPKTRVSHGP